MGGGNSKTVQTTEIVTELLNSSKTEVINKSVTTANATVATSQTLLDLSGATVSGSKLTTGNLTAEAKASIDLKSTMASMDKTNMTEEIAAKMANDAMAKMKSQDSIFPPGLFGGDTETEQKTIIKNNIKNVIESSVTNDDIKSCTANLVSQQTGIKADRATISDTVIGTGDITLVIDAKAIADCSFNITKTTDIVKKITTDVDNKMAAVQEKQNLVGSAGSALSDTATGLGTGVAGAAKGIGEGISSIMDSAFGPIIIIGIVVIAALFILPKILENPAIQGAIAQQTGQSGNFSMDVPAQGVPWIQQGQQVQPINQGQYFVGGRRK